MPLGNGEVGLNVWVEEGGDLLFLVSRTDAWSETCRLLKLGRVRVHLDPNPFAPNLPFRQTLALRSGRIEIEAGKPGEEVRLLVFVDSDRPVVRVLGDSSKPLRVTASLECWRNGRHVLKGEELQSSWTMHDAPASVEVWESPDRILDEPAAVAWCHFNDHSVVPETLAHQGLSSAASSVHDPLLHRAFGGWMVADGFVKTGRRALASKNSLPRFELRLAALTEPDASIESWAERARAVCENAPDAVEATISTRAWWERFWARSWIFVDKDAGRVTEMKSGAREPLRMAAAMRDACSAGRQAFLAGRIPRKLYANASSPTEGLIAGAGPAQR